MKLLQVALLFTFVMLVAHVAASSTRKSQNTEQTEEFQLEIPEHCQILGFCEDIPNYPKEQADKVISELSDLDMYQDEKLNSPDSTRRAGPHEDNIELCEFEEKLVYPKAATDSKGKWHVVLNKDDKKKRQGFTAEICKNLLSTKDMEFTKFDGETLELEKKDVESHDLTSCSGVAVFGNGYEGRCIQKFVYRKVAVLLEDGTKSHKSLKVPSCCSCMARLIIS